MDAELAGEIIIRMDHISRDWSLKRESSCVDHFVHGTLSKDEYEDIEECFNDVLSKVDSCVSSLDDSVDSAIGGLESLTEALEQCR